MSGTTVDILLATYNGERYIAEQIESLQRQTYRNWRLLVSDDCSTDDTLNIIHSYAAVDSRISVVSEGVRHGGAKENFMFLLGKSDAFYAMFCDQDDVWLPERVELTLGLMHDLEKKYGAESPLLVFADANVVDECLDVKAESFEEYSCINPNRTAFAQVLAQSIGAGCTYLINRPLMLLARRCTDIGSVVMHDWWVALVASAFGHIGHVDRQVLLYRQHVDNTIGAARFSAAGWLGRFDDMAESQRRIAHQAECFVDTYGSELTAEQTKAAVGCAATDSDSRWNNVLHLVQSGVWKSGWRKLGQFAGLLLGKRGR